MNNLVGKIYMTEEAYATSYKEIEGEILNKVSSLFTENSDDLSVDISNDGAVVTVIFYFMGEVTKINVERVSFKKGVKKMIIEGHSKETEVQLDFRDVPVWQQGFILLPLVRKIEKLEAERKSAPKQYTTIRVSVNLEFDGVLTVEELEKELCNLSCTFKDEDGKEISSGDMDWDLSEKICMTY